MAEPFNSDDMVDTGEIEAELAARAAKNRQWGALLESSILRETRVETKQAVNQAKHGLGSMGVTASFKANVDLWMARYDEILKTEHGTTGKGDPNYHPKGETVSFVLRVAAKQIKSRFTSQGEPMQIALASLKQGWLGLMFGFRRRHTDWRFSIQDMDLVKENFAQLSAAKTVRSGRDVVPKVPSLPIRSACIVARRYLNRTYERGTSSWDLPVNDLLVFSLLYATGFRAGDVGVAGTYASDTALSISDIKVWLAPAGDGFEQLRVDIQLHYFKGSMKGELHQISHQLRPLARAENACIDPVVWLLVVLCRRGLVEGASIEAILNAAARRLDRQVVKEGLKGEASILLLNPQEVNLPTVRTTLVE